MWGRNRKGSGLVLERLRAVGKRGLSFLPGRGSCVWKFSREGTWCAGRGLRASGTGERTQRPPVPVVPGCELLGWRAG